MDPEVLERVRVPSVRIQEPCAPGCENHEDDRGGKDRVYEDCPVWSMPASIFGIDVERVRLAECGVAGQNVLPSCTWNRSVSSRISPIAGSSQNSFLSQVARMPRANARCPSVVIVG